MEISKQLIADFRGGVPEKCSFCGKVMPPEQLEIEEAGDWACWHCLLRWAEEDGDVRQELFWKRAIRDVESRH